MTTSALTAVLLPTLRLGRQVRTASPIALLFSVATTALVILLAKHAAVLRLDLLTLFSWYAQAVFWLGLVLAIAKVWQIIRRNSGGGL